MLTASEGFRSFPSGHSSSSFAGLFYLSLYLAAKLHVLDQKGEVWRTCIVLIPTLAASCIAMSRIMDARHHPFDVLFGSALGILCAWASYRQYFPPVSHVWEKGRAYPMRIWGTPVRRPVPGKVLIDSDTLEVLDDRVPAESNGTSSYELTSGGLQSRVPRPDFQSHSITPSVDMDVEAGYQRSHQVPSQLQGTANAFRQQMEQNRRARAGYAGSSPETEHGGTDDEDEPGSNRPLQPSGPDP